MGSKKKSQRIHARRRAGMRYGINFGNIGREYFVRAIQHGKAIFLRKTTNRVSEFAVNYEGKWYPVIYDKNRKEIVTFLPEERLERYRSKLERACIQ